MSLHIKYTKPLCKKPGPICGGLRGANKTLGNHTMGKHGRRSTLPEDIEDAAFGTRATALAEAAWRAPRDED